MLETKVATRFRCDRCGLELLEERDVAWPGRLPKDWHVVYTAATNNSDIHAIYKAHNDALPIFHRGFPFPECKGECGWEGGTVGCGYDGSRPGKRNPIGPEHVHGSMELCKECMAALAAFFMIRPTVPQPAAITDTDVTNLALALNDPEVLSLIASKLSVNALVRT